MANTDLDISRHYELFDPHKFNTPVHVIGVGATGSWVALQLAKLGVSDITVWDDDKVEAHNVPNQAFGLQDLHTFKTKAIAQQIGWATGTQIKTRNERVTNQAISGIVFVMVDSMKARKEIWDNCLKFKHFVKHVIEPRMGIDEGRVYNVNPMELAQIKGYEAAWYSDEDGITQVSSCGTSMTLVSSAMAIAGICVRQFINYVDGTPLDNEILIDFKFNGIYPTKWK